MKKLIALTLFVAVSMIGCNWPPADENAEKLKSLQVGMTKEQVHNIVGEPHQGEGDFKRNPNVWWYYTQTKWSDGNVSTDECTPLCFDPKSGKLVGWGHDFYLKYILFGDYHRENWANPQYTPPEMSKGF